MNPYASIVITGGLGMLAHALQRNLTARGHRFAAVDVADYDLTKPDAVRQLFQDHRPTLVLNCAAHTKVDLCEQQQELADAVNGHAVGYLADNARIHDSYLIHFSTDFVFPGNGTRPYRPTDAVGPLSAYGRSKLLGEQKLQENPPPHWMIIRTAWLYGRNGPNFPRTIVERARGGGALKVVSDQVGSPTYTEDLAAATFDLIDRNAIGVWHLTNSGQTNWFEFAKAALEDFGVKAEVGSTTAAEWFKIRPTSAVRPAYSVLDIEPFAQRVGRPMRPWRDALREYATAVAAQGF